MKSRIVVLMLLAAFVASVGIAQTTATVTGSVTTDGAPLPGVTVTATSPSLQGSRTTVTDANGGYSMPALPPGRYELAFELDGMQPVTKRADLVLGVTNRVDATLRVAAVAEAITVTAGAPQVLETAQIATNITHQQVEELPLGRTVLAAALLAPGVNDNTASGSQLSISGGPGYDNLVMVNGVAITENVRSQALSLFIEDAIQETTVLTGSISAEYGRFTGGVVNSITKSGGNEFSGSLRDNLSNDSWSEKTPYAGEADPVSELNEVYEATLGGFILRDRLWFFTSGRSAETSASNQTSRSNIPFVIDREETRIEGKLTGQITPSHSLVGAFLDRESSTTNDRFSTVMDEASLYNREDPQSLLSAHYNGIFGRNFLIEAHFADRQYGISRGGGSQFRDLIKGTLMLDTRDGSRRFNSPTFCAACGNKDRDSVAYTLKGNYFLSTASLGSHSIVGGVERYSDRRFEPNNQSGSDFRVFVNGTVREGGTSTGVPLMTSDGQLFPIFDHNDARTFIRWTPVFSPGSENDLTTNSVFVNDRWDLNNNWSFNVGLRYDANDTVNADGDKVSDDSGFSPRLSAIWDPRGDGKYRFSASASRYQSRVVEGPATSGETAGAPGAVDFIYDGPIINAPGTPVDQLIPAHQALQMMWDWFLAQGGTDNLDLLKVGGAKSVPGFDVVFPSGLKSPSVDEFVVGFGTQIGSTAYAKFDVIYRDWNDFYSFRVTEANDTVVDFLGIGHDLQIVENTNNIDRTYEGLQVQSAWRPRVHGSRFNVGVNYTWSKLEGNDTQESANSGVIGNDDPKNYYPEFLAFPRWKPTGYLDGDQRHKLRAWVGYDVPLPSYIGRVNASLLHNFDSGLPYSAVDTIDFFRYPGAPEFGDKLFYSGLGSPSYYFSERGAFRTDDIHSTDFALNLVRPIFGGLEIFAQAEMFNVFDNDSVDSVNTTVRTWLDGTANCKQADGSRCALFNPFTDTPVEGVHWVKGPDFGKPTSAGSYQDARSYRFSVGFRF
ncbi:MAG: TonB-dependent receptor [Thermoanaerobaculia bacterium]